MRIKLFIPAALILFGCGNNNNNKPAEQDSVITSDKVPPQPNTPDTIFTGSGTEPFWAVYIIENDKIVYHPSEGTEIKVPLVTPVSTDNNRTTKYSSANDSVAFELTIIKKDCNNGMSDIIYPYEVSLKINAATYNGCGKYGRF